MLARMYITRYSQQFCKDFALVPYDPSIQFTQAFCVIFHILQLKLDCRIFPVLAVTMGSLSLYSRHQKRSVSEVRTVYQQRSRHGHFMGADPDKRIHKLPRRLKAVKTVVTVITETDFVACHEDVGAMKQNHCSVPGILKGTA